MKRIASHVTLLALLVLATAGMVLQAGSVPHVHTVAQAGLYNQEHDLTLLAGLASNVVPVVVTPGLPVDVVSISLVPVSPERPVVRAALSGDSRAPPVR